MPEDCPGSTSRPRDPRADELVKRLRQVFPGFSLRFSIFGLGARDLDRDTKVQIIPREWREASPGDSFDSFNLLSNRYHAIYMYVTLN